MNSDSSRRSPETEIQAVRVEDADGASSSSRKALLARAPLTGLDLARSKELAREIEL